MARPISKTALLELVKQLRAADVRAASKPVLRDVRDERGRNWLRIAARKRDPAYRRLAAAIAARV